jgi:hypothetical protein
MFYILPINAREKLRDFYPLYGSKTVLRHLLTEGVSTISINQPFRFGFVILKYLTSLVRKAV